MFEDGSLSNEEVEALGYTFTDIGNE